MRNPRISFRLHAVQRMFERNIPFKKVCQAARSGETIEDYTSEMPEPARLILGTQGKRPFHVVTSEHSQTGDITVITVYIPDAAKWDRQFKSRRS